MESNTAREKLEEALGEIRDRATRSALRFIKKADNAHPDEALSCARVAETLVRTVVHTGAVIKQDVASDAGIETDLQRVVREARERAEGLSPRASSTYPATSTED